MFLLSSLKKNILTCIAILCLGSSTMYPMSNLPSLKKTLEPLHQDSSFFEVCESILQLPEYEYTEDIASDFGESYEPIISMEMLSNLIAHVFSSMKEEYKQLYNFSPQDIDCLFDEEQGICAKAFTVQPEATIISIGDLHGNAHSLARIINALYKRKLITRDGILDKDAYLIFTGDLGDRGHYSIETWFLALLLYKKNPKKVTILQGNHETKKLIEMYGMLNELTIKYQKFCDSCFYDILNRAFFELFYLLPQTCFVGTLNAQNSYTFTQYFHAGLPDFLAENNEYFSLQFNKLLNLTIRNMNNNAMTIYPQAPKHNGLIWNSFFSDPEAPAIKLPGNRCPLPNGAAQDQQFHGIATLNYLEAHRKEKVYSVCGIIRGHDHLKYVSQLAYNKHPEPSRCLSNLELANWTPIKHPILLQVDPQNSSFPVVSISSLANILDYDNFITLTFNKVYDTWQVNPFSKNKYDDVWQTKSQEITILPNPGMLSDYKKQRTSLQIFRLPKPPTGLQKKPITKTPIKPNVITLPQSAAITQQRKLFI
ncbi:MAG: Serine/threonine-protein phosphatase [candidate division TM6 bacterium GW2011_GWF2_38_10]|nr:MAG: Serine/threonine-protein phosphatase [candidate division TM6 bacterium GW2011_GWF2_38_10]